MTHEEVQKGLECCLAPLPKCNDCPMKPYAKCTHVLKHGALIHMREMEEQIMLFKIQIRGDCGVCKHVGVHIGKEPCKSCVLKEDHPAWEYIGFPEVNKK